MKKRMMLLLATMLLTASVFANLPTPNVPMDGDPAPVCPKKYCPPSS